jgi:hypothetical protein
MSETGSADSQSLATFNYRTRKYDNITIEDNREPYHDNDSEKTLIVEKRGRHNVSIWF